MTKLKALAVSVSLDGFAAGPEQVEHNPLGVGGTRLHEWIFVTKSGREMIGEEGGSEGVDNDFFKLGFDDEGATIMGRNMFGPVRGDWTEPLWNGWWGEDPPFHHPVFVLTHHARESLVMAGGTTFHFVTDGADAALEMVKEAAGDGYIIFGGGASTIQQFLRSRAIDELHFAVVPIFLGAAERLFDDLDGAMDDYQCVETTSFKRVTHYRWARVDAAF